MSAQAFTPPDEKNIKLNYVCLVKRLLFHDCYICGGVINGFRVSIVYTTLGVCNPILGNVRGFGSGVQRWRHRTANIRPDSSSLSHFFSSLFFFTSCCPTGFTASMYVHTHGHTRYTPFIYFPLGTVRLANSKSVSLSITKQRCRTWSSNSWPFWAGERESSGWLVWSQSTEQKSPKTKLKSEDL